MKTRTIALLLIGTLMSIPHFTMADERPDTAFSFLFRVKMAKAVAQGTFDPDSGKVYVVSEPGFGTVQLAAGAGYIYEGSIVQGLDSGQAYTFRFRINDTGYETVDRTITANPGTTEYTAWWNDDPINVTTFNVDMTYMVAAAAFNPETDSMDITGTMNGWTGSPLMQRVDTTYVYTLSLPLDPGTVYQYRYRINRDTARVEFPGLQPRYFRAPDTLITLDQFFNDYNPATVAMTFLCDMRYQEASGNFDPATDYLDISGNFNGGGAWDLLYLQEGDSIPRATMYFDTAMIGGDPLTFKFRINGDPAREELAGEPARSYTLHEPSVSDSNRYYCWFDNADPNVPAAPWVTDLFIQGNLISGSTVTGSYAYHNLNGIPEGESLYKWYKADSVGATLVPIDSAWQVNYTIDSTLDVGYFLVFEVTPVAASGDSAVGVPVQVWSDWAVGGLGIGEKTRLNVSFYPNPVSDVLRINSQEKQLDVTVMDLTGRKVIGKSLEQPGLYNLEVGELAPGTYLLYLSSPGRGTGSSLLIKR